MAKRPSEAELATLYAALPRQPKHVGVVLAGNRQHAGWWGKAEQASWADAVQAARTIAQVCGVELTITAGNNAPWHPGRCAELRVGGQVVGHAGELHPKVIEALDLPKRTCAMEIDLDTSRSPKTGPRRPCRRTRRCRWTWRWSWTTRCRPRRRAGVASGQRPLLEHLELFDVYTGEQVGDGKRSLAYALRFRARDRTLTTEDATKARDAGVELAAQRCKATLRA